MKARSVKITGFPGAPARTLIDKGVADRLVGSSDAYGPRACVRWAGQRWCGPTIRLTIEMPPCKPVTVNAIATDLQRKLTPAPNAITGRELLEQVVERIDISTGTITCRRRSVLR